MGVAHFGMFGVRGVCQNVTNPIQSDAFLKIDSNGNVCKNSQRGVHLTNINAGTIIKFTYNNTFYQLKAIINDATAVFTLKQCGTADSGYRPVASGDIDFTFQNFQEL